MHRGIFIGAGLAVFGVIAGVFWFALQMPGISDDIDRLQRSDIDLPLEFEVAQPVVWTLFVEPSSASLSGVRFAVIDVDGIEMPLDRAGGDSYEWFGRSGRPVAEVELPAGSYRLQVEGTATVAIGSGPGDKLSLALRGAALLGVPLVIGGLALAIVSAVRDTRRRTQNAEPAPPSPWSAGEWPTDPGR